MASPVLRRLIALSLLGALLLLGVGSAAAMLNAFADGQREITAKQAQLRNLRELAAARTAFERLAPRKGGLALILPAEADAAATLQGAVTHAADGQQVIVDGVDALPPDAVTRTAAVHLRGTQAGLYAFLKTIEAASPYILVPRLEVTPSRSADPDNGKPFVVSADLRLAVLVAPAPPARRAAPASEPASP